MMYGICRGSRTVDPPIGNRLPRSMASEPREGRIRIPIRWREWLTRIQQAGWHLLEMINDILDLAKIESGKMEVRLSDFDIGPVVCALCDVDRPLGVYFLYCDRLTRAGRAGWTLDMFLERTESRRREAGSRPTRRSSGLRLRRSRAASTSWATTTTPTPMP